MELAGSARSSAVPPGGFIARILLRFLTAETEEKGYGLLNYFQCKRSVLFVVCRRAQERNGSGYRVARILSASSKAEQGHAVITLTVDLGDGECIIDGQYVSNKQFTEVRPT